MTMQCLKYHQVQGLCIPSRGLFVNPKNEATRGVQAVVSGDPIDYAEAREGKGSVKAAQVPRGKLWRAIKSTFICFGEAGEDIALYCLIGDDLHPYRMNYCDGPISSRGRQLNRDIAEVPWASERNVVNVASSMVTAPLIKSGPCSGKRGASTRLVWAKSTLWRSRRVPNR